MKPKRCLFILRVCPLESRDLQEVFDQLLTFKAFDQYVSLLFLDQSVQLLNHSSKGRPPGLQGLLDALAFYEVDQIMVERESLLEQQLSLEALSIPVTVMARSEWSQLIHQQDIVVAG